MVVEVTGVSTWNKGAELMLVAIRDHFEKHHPNVQLAVNQHFGSYEERAQYGLLQKFDMQRIGRSKLALALMPESFRRSLGVVQEDEIDVILDASGFAFGDQHPAERTVRFAEEVERARDQGKKVVFLPQALGPFENHTIRQAFARIVRAAHLIFARDEISLQYAREAAGDHGQLQLAPDFTNLVKPNLNIRSDDSNTACIVPNQRMIEKADSREEAKAYVPFIASCIEAVAEHGLEPILLLHGSPDIELVGSIERELGRTIPLVNEEDPLTIKRILGESHLVVASRFHALVGALSQSVPCLATSWSHKYEMLFRDYGCEGLLLPVEAEKDQIRDRVNRIIGRCRKQLISEIEGRAEQWERCSQKMWCQVDKVLELKANHETVSLDTGDVSSLIDRETAID